MNEVYSMKRKMVFAPITISAICFLIIVFADISLSYAEQSSFHFSMITINSIFAGFLYTNYSLLLGLLGNEKINKLLGTSIIKKRNDRIFIGIICSVVSIIAGLILAIATAYNTGQTSQVQITGNLAFSAIFIVETVFMAFGIIYFTLSIKEMHVLVSAASKPTKKVDQDIIQKVRTAIKDNEE